MPNGPNWNMPPPGREAAETLAESKRGMHSQSTDPSGAMRKPVWQSDRKAYSAIGVNGDGSAALDVVGVWRRRSRAVLLCGEAHPPPGPSLLVAPVQTAVEEELIRWWSDDW